MEEPEAEEKDEVENDFYKRLKSNAMKQKLILLIVLAMFFVNLSAQDNTSGIVTYEQITTYDFGDYQSDPRWKAWLEDQPKQGKYRYVLSFTNNTGFYEKDPSDKTQMPQKLQAALRKANYNKGPKTQIKQTFYNYEQSQQTEQLEFMTRDFQVTSALPTRAWKLTSKKKKVLDYICIGAEVNDQGQTYTAWFTAEIPVSAGPAGYQGLPGLVLAVEKNEEVFILATKVDLSIQPDKLKAKLIDGKKISKEQFDQIVIEKTEEFKAAMKSKSKGGGAKRLSGKGE